MTEENGGGKVAKNKSKRNKFKNPDWKEKQKLKAEQVKEILEQKLKKNELKVDKKKEILQKKKSKKVQKKEKLKKKLESGEKAAQSAKKQPEKLEETKSDEESESEELETSSSNPFAALEDNEEVVDLKVENPARARRRALKEKLETQLKAAEFRFINEQLYRSDDKSCKKILSGDAAKIYHEGFAKQVEKWPINPVDLIIDYIEKKLPKNHIIVDMGCGEAKLSASLKHKVHSFDLVKHNERVTACDVRKTPLETNAVDAVVFCLALMAERVDDFIKEANRILKTGGKLFIAEVKSRLENEKKFKKALGGYGFTMVSENDSNTHFTLLVLKKFRDIEPKANLPALNFRACQYKKR